MELFGFGPHLMIDGYHADAAKLADVDLVRAVLNQLPHDMEMTKILEPSVFEFSNAPDETGVTGVVIIAESHIAIHTFPVQGFLAVDVFSCKDFDSARALRTLVEAFEVGRYDTHFINRGKEFPRDEKLIETIVRGEREYVAARI
ncbi:MAG TPA: adenosylmethionine decarboxylase [Deinococcales bacterium]|nr:adenosylmethionine decarboxylase [Deinococcales bacterium]